MSLPSWNPFRRTPSTYRRKRLKYLWAEFFFTKIENSFTEAHACTAYSSKNGLPSLLNRKNKKLIPRHFGEAATECSFLTFQPEPRLWTQVQSYRTQACGLLITDLLDKSTNTLAWYTRPCKPIPHLFGVISRRKPLYVSPSSNSTLSQLPRPTAPFTARCSSASSSLCLGKSALLPPCSVWKKCTHASRLTAATIIWVNSSLTSLKKKMNHCLLLVVCNSVVIMLHPTTACLPVPCDYGLQGAGLSSTLLSSWPRTWHLVVLHKCSINE